MTKILKLPRPKLTRVIGSSIFEIYKAKGLYNNRWYNARLREQVAVARTSYLKYGEVPIFDAYDAKAAIFLCRVRPLFSSSAMRKAEGIEEWLCARFIPGDGIPASTEDLDQYAYRDKCVKYRLKELFFRRQKSYAGNIVTISRVCGISNRLVVRKGRKALLSFMSGTLRYSSLSLLLINFAFFSESESGGFRYLTAMFRDELFRKIVKDVRQISGCRLFFPVGYRLLKCGKREIHLVRGRLAYSYPGYFLNLRKIAQLFGALIKKRQMTIQSIKNFLPNFSSAMLKSIASFSNKELLYKMQGVGELLAVRGKIPGAGITGACLRRLIDKKVPDGSNLRIVSIADWKKQISHIVAILGKNKSTYGVL